MPSFKGMASHPDKNYTGTLEMTDIKPGEFIEVDKLESKTEMTNLGIWFHADKIDPNYTKKDTNGGYTSLTLNSYWIFKKATELWGPVGKGWGYRIVEERFDKGHTIYHKPSLAKGVLVELATTTTHTLLVKVWYKSHFTDGEKKTYSVPHYGHTPYVIDTKNGPMTDHDAPKKSLTDAIKKCLSMLGFAGEVFMGEYDNPAYMNVVKTEFDIKNAENKDAVTKEKQEALRHEVIKILESIKVAVIPNEATILRNCALTDLGRQSGIPELHAISQDGIKAIENIYAKKLESLAKKEGKKNGSRKAATV